MSDRLRGKLAVITGATSGIGEATARLFVAQGARVLMAGRQAEKGQALVRELGERAAFQVADVTREDDIARLLDGAVQLFGRVDCLFNNAGSPVQGTLADVTEADVAHAMRLLFGSALFGIKHAARVMKAQGSGGSIVCNASIAAHRIGQGDMLYSSAKAAVLHLARLMAVELGGAGIRVNTISPGAIATPIFLSGAVALSAEERERKLARLATNLAHATPLPRGGLPEDIAQAALFLASDEGSFVNGHDLVVDGGRIWQYHERSR